jgi:hypothetical protein
MERGEGARGDDWESGLSGFAEVGRRFIWKMLAFSRDCRLFFPLSSWDLHSSLFAAMYSRGHLRNFKGYCTFKYFRLRMLPFILKGVIVEGRITGIMN